MHKVASASKRGDVSESSSVRLKRGSVSMIKISDFQMKDVVNVANGKKLGNVGDIDINLGTGKIESVIINHSSRMLGFFGKDEDIVIPWRNIVKIGEDVILVRHKQTEEDENK